jgi:signal transduction histidine kinase
MADPPNEARAPSLWRDRKSALATGLVAEFFQKVLIAKLVRQRRALVAARSEAQEHRSELAHAGRLAMVGELSASIAHEINQPLGAILSNADAAELLLESRDVRLDEVRQILGDIRSDTLRAHEVIRRLRSLLEKHEVELREVDLHAALADVIQVVAAEAQRREIDVQTRLGARAAIVQGDKVQLQQVVLNLTLNAMDAMAGTPPGLRRVTLTTADADGRVELQVRDNGHGIKEQDAGRIFSSFYTTKEGGMGLGLSIARSIVQAHGGTLSASSRPGRGAVFTLCLPKSIPQGRPVLRAAADPVDSTKS